jgi:hypothetical protein
MDFKVTTLHFQENYDAIQAKKKCVQVDDPQIMNRVMDMVAQHVKNNCIAETDCDGFAWPKLSTGYETWKNRFFPGQLMGILWHHMLAMDQLEGTRILAKDRSTMTYGLDPIAKEEAEKFQEGGAVTGTNQPPRGFYGLTYQAISALDQIFDHIFMSH